MIFYLLTMTIRFSVKTRSTAGNVRYILFLSWMFLRFRIFIKLVSTTQGLKAISIFFLLLQDFILNTSNTRYFRMSVSKGRFHWRITSRVVLANERNGITPMVTQVTNLFVYYFRPLIFYFKISQSDSTKIDGFTFISR